MKLLILIFALIFVSVSTFASDKDSRKNEKTNKTYFVSNPFSNSEKMELQNMKAWAADTTTAAISIENDTVKINGIGNILNEPYSFNTNFSLSAITNVTFLKFTGDGVETSFSPGCGLAFNYLPTSLVDKLDYLVSANIFLNGGIAVADNFNFYGSVAFSLGVYNNKYQIGRAKVFGSDWAWVVSYKISI